MNPIKSLELNKHIFNFLILLIAILSFSYVIDSSFTEIDFTLLFIGLIASFNLYLAIIRQNISFAFIHWFFILLFFFLVPYLSYNYNAFLHLGYIQDYNSLLFQANKIIIIWSILFTIAYELSNHTFSFNLKSIKSIHINYYITLPLIILIYSLIILNVLTTQPRLLLFRGENSHYYYNQIYALIFNTFIRPLPLILSLLMLSNNKINFRKIPLLFILPVLFFALLLNLPTSTARYYAFFILLTLFLYQDKSKYGFKLIALMTFGIFASSILNSFRYIKNFSQLNSAVDIDSFSTVNYLLTGSFDAYEMLAIAINYVNNTTPLWGKNFLGAALFFVPRSMWPDKPIGSGAFLADNYFSKLGLYDGFSNLSCPLIAESYLGFGYLGVVIISILAGILIGSMDRYYKHTLSKEKKNPITILYYLLCSMFFFNLRGDLMSSLAYTIAMSLSFYLCIKLLGYRLKFKITV